MMVHASYSAAEEGSAVEEGCGLESVTSWVGSPVVVLYAGSFNLIA